MLVNCFMTIIALVDDENSIRTSVSLALESEGFKVDVFNHQKNIFNPNNVYDANNATPNLLFKNEEKFHKKFPQYKIVYNKLSEFFIFLNSGGVVQKTYYIPVNKFF